MKNKGGRQVPNCVPESVTESSKDDIIKDLDKAKNDLLKKVDVLIAKKKKLYSDVDIESPMTADEKKLDKDIADLFSDINKLVLQKRSLKESQAVSGGKVHKLITGKNLKFKGKSYNQIDFETLGVDNKNGTIRLRIIAPKEIFGNEMSLDFRTVRRGPFFKTDSSNQLSEAKTYKKGDKLKIKLPNGKKFDVVFDSYSRTKGVGMGKFKDGSGEYDIKPFNLDTVVESVNEASYVSGYTLKAKTPYEFVNGAYAILNAYLRDEELGLKGKKELQNILKSLEYMRKYFFFKLNESVNEGRGIKSIQKDLDKTITAIESEIASYKETKGTPKEKKHIDNLKKLHPIKKKLEAELDGVVSGLYRDAELKIEN